MPDPLVAYLKLLRQAIDAGNAAEQRRRAVLKALVESLKPKVTATNEPRHVECGAPDFIVTHHSDSDLDNPTFRGMRQQLMNAFDEIRIMDLHGGTKKKERCPDGSKDGNVFDIQQGVAICLMIKLPEGGTSS